MSDSGCVCAGEGGGVGDGDKFDTSVAARVKRRAGIDNYLAKLTKKAKQEHKTELPYERTEEDKRPAGNPQYASEPTWEAAAGPSEGKTTIKVAARQSQVPNCSYHVGNHAWEAKPPRVNGKRPAGGKSFSIKLLGEQGAREAAENYTRELELKHRKQDPQHGGRPGARRATQEGDPVCHTPGVLWHKRDKVWLVRWHQNGQRQEVPVKPSDHGNSIERAMNHAIAGRREKDSRDRGGTVYLATATDRQQYAGLLALLRSLWRNLKVHNEVEVHVFAAKGDIDCLKRLMKCADGARKGVGVFSAEEEGAGRQWSRRVVLHGVSSDNITVAQGGHGDQVVFNFVRFYLARFLPGSIERVIWIDPDTIIQGDVSDLFFGAFRRAAGREAGLAAVPRSFTRLNYDISAAIGLDAYRVLRSRLTVARDLQMFNAGVLVLNLTMWRRDRLTDEAEGLIGLLRSLNITSFRGMSTAESSQLPMNILFRNRVMAILDPEWNVLKLGYDAADPPSQDTLSRGRILHWNGLLKPWLANSRYRQHWLLYHSVRCCTPLNQFIRRPAAATVGVGASQANVEAAACGC
ncbi:unnamed protein product [Vitrella brassicaformis CCMP3155]|uniref:Hexosyltransferase n=1 Tax=Vitrella brassicaformis (strain CCMP3155) TaxID=1169540 RepID=A0A0G4ENX4_VITBC|nr:unnamed protein product [Vitrella brassicaformis CCMP3155]|eukprot:CEL99500.1 unnamed protein product [Vitrella brassicaformis CCMP3155]